MTTKKYIMGIAASAIMLAAVSSLVIAQTDTVAPGFEGKLKIEQKVMPTNTVKPMVVEIGPGGRALLRGVVDSVGTNYLMVKSWGGLWKVAILNSTQLMPTTDMSQFKPGDFVGVQGMALQQDWIIDASLVRNWTVRAVEQTNKKEVKDLMRSVQPKNWEGVVSDVNVDAKTFKLKIGDTTYNVNLATSYKIVSESYGPFEFTSIKAGDTVQVYGPATDATITAVLVRYVRVRGY